MSDIEGFPDHRFANEEGLLALGGDLSAERLLLAYCNGIFPWYNPGEPILWWSPDPRCVLFPEDFKASRSLRQSIRKQQFTFTFDSAFDSVIQSCALPRKSESGIWITAEMKHAYTNLHKLGFAHSVETWQDNELVGGLYGIAIGKVFFGESMFSTKTDASKSALQFLVKHLVENEFQLIDCQITSSHLLSLGACEICRQQFIELVKSATKLRSGSKIWPSPAPMQ